METTICLSNGISLLIQHKEPLSLKEGDIIKLEIPPIDVEIKHINNIELEITNIWRTIKDIKNINFKN